MTGHTRQIKARSAVQLPGGFLLAALIGLLPLTLPSIRITMLTHQLPGSHDASQIVEHEIRAWALQMDTQRRLAEQSGKASPKQLIHPCVTIARESGVEATRIANFVAAENNWKVLDRGILDQMAERFNWSRDSLEYVWTRQTASWFQEVFGKWLDAQLVSQIEFVHRLGRDCADGSPT